MGYDKTPDIILEVPIGQYLNCKISFIFVDCSKPWSHSATIFYNIWISKILKENFVVQQGLICTILFEPETLL